MPEPAVPTVSLTREAFEDMQSLIKTKNALNISLLAELEAMKLREKTTIADIKTATDRMKEYERLAKDATADMSNTIQTMQIHAYNARAQAKEISAKLDEMADSRRSVDARFTKIVKDLEEYKVSETFELMKEFKAFMEKTLAEKSEQRAAAPMASNEPKEVIQNECTGIAPKVAQITESEYQYINDFKKKFNSAKTKVQEYMETVVGAVQLGEPNRWLIGDVPVSFGCGYGDGLIHGLTINNKGELMHDNDYAGETMEDVIELLPNYEEYLKMLK
jgi:hypothetical protein